MCFMFEHRSNLAVRSKEANFGEREFDGWWMIIRLPPGRSHALFITRRITINVHKQSGRESAIAGSSENARMSELMRDIAMLRRRHRHDQREQ